MVMIFTVSMITVAVSCISATIVVSMAVKNQFIKRLNRQVRYWQERALADEQALKRCQKN